MNADARQSFLAERMTGIGGSDAAAALGLSPWKQPLELYLEKRGEIPPVDENEAMRWGTILEPVIRQEYANRTGRTVTVPPLIRHPQYDFLIVHLDGLTNDRRGFEAKTARTADGWGEPGTDEVPQPYLIQCQHGMLAADLDVMDLAVLIAGSDWRLYEIPADVELQQMILEGEADIWERIREGRPPEPDWSSPATPNVIRRLYPGTTGEILTATHVHEQWRAVMEDAAARAKTYSEAAEAAKAHLLWEMGEAAALKFSDGKALRRKLTTRKGYTVADESYIDARIVNLKEKA